MAKNTTKTTAVETKSEPSMLEAVKAAFKDSEGRDIILSDKVLQSVLDNAKTWDDMDDEGKIAFLVQAEQTAKQVMIHDPGITNLVAKLDTKAMDEIISNIDAELKRKVTAVSIYANFKRIYSADEMNSAPYPGTDVDTIYGNYRPDITKRKDSVSGEMVTVQWTHDFADKLPAVKGWLDDLEQISAEIKSANASSKYKGWSTAALNSEKATLTARRNAARSMVKKAFELHHQFEAVNGMEKVTIQWITVEGNDKNVKAIDMPKQYGKDSPVERVTASPKNLWLAPKGNPGGGKVISVAQLNAFDVPKAIAAGGTKGDLENTSKKGSKDTGTDAGDGADMDEGKAYETFNRMANYLNKRDNMANVRRIMADKNADTRTDWLENIGTLYHLIAPMYRTFRSQIEEVTGTPQTEHEAA